MIINKKSKTNKNINEKVKLDCLNQPIKKTRMTPQKKVILDYIKTDRCHPNAERVFEAVKKEMPMITLATVYRNLNQLAEEGEIIRLEIDHEYRYDGFSKKHFHFICNNTGKIYDIENEDVIKYIKKKIPSEFEPEKISIILRGECKRNIIEDEI